MNNLLEILKFCRKHWLYYAINGAKRKQITQSRFIQIVHHFGKANLLRHGPDGYFVPDDVKVCECGRLIPKRRSHLSYGYYFCNRCWADQIRCYDHCHTAPRNHPQWINTVDRGWLLSGEHRVYQWNDNTWKTYAQPQLDHMGIPYYHSAIRSWRDKSFKDRKLLGVELEIFTNSVKAVYAALPEGLVAERDGSLHNTKGLEIIGPPIRLADYHKGYWDKVFSLPILVPNHKYGMHVNINRGAFESDKHIERFARFIIDHQRICERIADRMSTDNHKYLLVGDKHQAVNVSNNQRVEVRIFNSTTTKKGFLKNVEFCAALQAYTRVNKLCDMKSFLKWLSKNNKQYKHIHDFVRKLCA